MDNFKIKNKYKIIFALLVFGAVFLVCGSVFAEVANTTAGTGVNTGTAVGSVSDQSNNAMKEITGDDTAKPFFLLVWISSFAAGILVLLSLLINFSIAIGSTVISLPIVQAGSQAMISFANLGFVFAIIVMAFATIFRVQSYAMKQILWKLIVAALLVNFSLTIAGAFISVSNIFTDFFLQGLNFKSFSDGLMGVLNPQGLVKVEDASAWNKISSPFGAIFKTMASLLFVIIFTFVIILTFLALAIMLLIRTVILGILLVIMPIVWLLWIFPGTSKYWSEWWSNFIRWTFFAPIVLFFTVLVISSGTQLKNIRDLSGMGQQQNAQMEQALKDSVTLNPDFFDHVAQIIITTGLLLGGLFAANRMGITFASTAMGMAKGGGKMFGGWVGKKSLQYGTSILNKPRGEQGKEKSYAQKISEWSAGSKIAKYTILPGLAARGIAKFSAAGGENLVKQAKDGAGKRSLNENTALLGYGSLPTRQGILAHLQEKELLGKVPNVLNKYINSDNQKKFAQNGQAVTFANIEKALGINVAMKEKFDEGKMEEFYTEGKKFFAKMSDKDWSKIQHNEIFSEKSEYGNASDPDSLHGARQRALAYGVAEKDPGRLAAIMPKIKGENFDRFKIALVEGNTTEAAKRPTEDGEKISDEKWLEHKKFAEMVNNLKNDVSKKRLWDSYSKNLLRREVGFEEYTPPPAPASSA